MLNIFSNNYTELKPIVKWPGGKEKELKYIIPNLPKFNRYFEPFVGGGSVFMAVNSEKYYINDFSNELIELYRNIASSNQQFFKYLENIDTSWENVFSFFEENIILVEIYLQYRSQKINQNELKDKINHFCINNKEKILKITSPFFSNLPCILEKEMSVNLYRKMVRMKELENKIHILPEKDLFDNIETALKSALYMNYRYLYNQTINNLDSLHIALFFFIRNYAYSGMFRYSSKGEFNVPYGGIGYNKKIMAKKIDYYKSDKLLQHFKKSEIYNLDFEQFLHEIEPQEDDFVFLDPPYDSEFNTYAKNSFTKKDQERLANYLLRECKAKWMLIIKNTDFIYNLYNKEEIKIKSFDKEYLVSFMNRNDKKVTHLLITNY
ncbi:MAG: DNA adenine methylase [Bacteroidales bacterium]|nr:DNA adenine methylase [Bacteroidales bacterium]